MHFTLHGEAGLVDELSEVRLERVGLIYDFLLQFYYVLTKLLPPDIAVDDGLNVRQSLNQFPATDIASVSYTHLTLPTILLV